MLSDEDNEASAKTILQCVRPLTKVGDIKDPTLVEITSTLCLIPGDLALAGFEDTLSSEWPNALGSSELYRPFRILTAFSTVMQAGAAQMDASIVLADVGPNLWWRFNRSALIATDYIIVPLGADLFSLQGLRNLGPTLNRWRQDWQRRRDHWAQSDFPLPDGAMQPVGYVVQQHGVRLNSPVRAYDKWVNRMPEEYARNLCGDNEGPYPATPTQDEEYALAHRQTLPELGADGSGSTQAHFSPHHGRWCHWQPWPPRPKDAHRDFRDLAKKIIQRINLGDP